MDNCDWFLFQMNTIRFSGNGYIVACTLHSYMTYSMRLVRKIGMHSVQLMTSVDFCFSTIFSSVLDSPSLGSNARRIFCVWQMEFKAKIRNKGQLIGHIVSAAGIKTWLEAFYIGVVRNNHIVMIAFQGSSANYCQNEKSFLELLHWVIWRSNGLAWNMSFLLDWRQH